MLEHNALLTILPLFLLMVVGYVTKRTGLFDVEKAKVLNDLIIYLAIPCLIFRSVDSSSIRPELTLLVGIFIVAMLLACAISYLLARLFSVENRIIGVLLIGSFLGNTGYLGYPMTLTLLGDESLPLAVFIDVFGTVFLLFTAGLYLVEKLSDSNQHVNKVTAFLTFPPFLALIAAIVFQNFSLPGPLNQMVNLLADAAVPIIMVSIGINLTFSSVRNSWAAYAIGGVVKLIVLPLLVFLIAGALLKGEMLNQEQFKVLVLQAAMPTAMMTQVLVVRYGLESSFLPALIFATTLLSLITVPMWLVALG